MEEIRKPTLLLIDGHSLAFRSFYAFSKGGEGGLETNGIMVVKSGLPSFIVTLAMLFILRGATLALTRLITGRTQVPGLRVLIENDPIAWIFATDTFTWLFNWLGSMNLIALRTDGSPLATGIPPSVIWFIALAILTTWILLWK